MFYTWGIGIRNVPCMGYGHQTTMQQYLENVTTDAPHGVVVSCSKLKAEQVNCKFTWLFQKRIWHRRMPSGSVQIQRQHIILYLKKEKELFLILRETIKITLFSQNF